MLRILQSRRTLLTAGIVVASALLATAIIVVESPAVDALRERGILLAERVASDGDARPAEIVIVAPGEAAAGASAGGQAPGPDGTAATVADAGSFGPTSPLPDAQATGVLQLPSLRIALGAILAQAGGGDSAFVYRAAIEARDAADYARAIQLFDAVTSSGGALAPFAALRAAQTTAIVEAAAAGEASAAEGSQDGAGAAAERFAVLLTPAGGIERLPLAVRAVAYLEGARALAGADRTAEALAALGALDVLDVGASTLAEAAMERARLLEAMSDQEWPAAAIRAMQLAPGSAASQAALDLLDARGMSYPGMVGAYVAYRSFRNDDATARYEELLGSGALSEAETAVAWFYLGALRERAWDGEGALEAYAALLAVDGEGALAPDARYWRGRVMEELGRPAEAVEEYDQLVADHPTSAFAEDARLRAAVALGLGAGIGGEALSEVEAGAEATARLAAITRTGRPEAAAEAAHWHAVLVELSGAPPADVAPAASYDPTSYAAVFELAGAAVTGPLPPAALQERVTPIAVDRAAIDVWLADQGRTRNATTSALQSTEVRLAWTLVAAGEAGVARGLLQQEINQRRDEPYELVSIAIAADEHGLHDMAMRAAQAVLAPVAPHDEIDAPRGLLGLAYPVPYLPAAAAAADEFGVPILLLYALMRQESAFHPEAGSSAGAFGLTQVIPPTGEDIAAALGETDWTFLDLARPEVATRFGAYCLALQLEAFDGHMLAALAAYNGGPGNAARWLQNQQFAGPDGYLYAVDFTETRHYLELVSANYAMYRYIYLGLETPRLPHE